MASPYPPDSPDQPADPPAAPEQPDVPQPAAPSDTPSPGPDAPGDAPEPAQPEPAPAPGADVSQHKVRLLDVTARVENFFANHPELDKGLMTELRSGMTALERFF